MAKSLQNNLENQKKHILSVGFQYNFSKKLKELGTLTFNDIHLLQPGQLMYSKKNSFLPPRLVPLLQY